MTVAGIRPGQIRSFVAADVGVTYLVLAVSGRDVTVHVMSVTNAAYRGVYVPGSNVLMCDVDVCDDLLVCDV